MKKITTLISTLFLSAILFAQAPSKMSYQAVVRNSTGSLVINQATGFQIEIRRNTATGTLVYSEVHTPTTNENGLATFHIGTGTNTSGSFGNINWDNGPYFIVTKVDPTGGASYTITGSQELLSVPFSMYAKEAGTANYNNLTNKPNFTNFDTNKNDDFSGNYNDLTNKPWTVSGSNIYRTSGKLGLGTNSPSQLMELKSSNTDNFLRINSGSPSGYNAGIMFYEPGYNFGWYMHMNAGTDNFYLTHKAGASASAFTVAMTYLKNGDVCIGSTDPTERLEVKGNVFVSGGDVITALTNGVINVGGGKMNSTANVIADATPTISYATGDEDLYIQDDLEVAGSAYKPGGGSWTTISDRRLKKDISDYKDGLSQLMKIKPVWFTYNEKAHVFDADKKHVGIIAQEMKEVAPYMVEEKALFQKVMEDENGNEIILDAGENYLTYDESALTYMMVNAIKEQQAMIKALEEKIKLLENK